MVKRTVREILFYVLILALFFLSVKTWQYWNGKGQSVSLLIVGIIYTLILVAMYYIANLNKCGEGFWDVTPAAKCKGGPYMWQGDSNTAKMCREMAETDKGKCAIASYNCPTGFEGQPKIPFYYAPLSGDTWQNERCGDGPAPCNCTPTGDPNNLTAFERVVPFDVEESDD